jgi:hypothetical protein
MLTERQSEIAGIMFGDGSMSVVGGSIQIAVTGHKIEDKNYLVNHVCPLLAQEFGVQMKSGIDQTRTPWTFMLTLKR